MSQTTVEISGSEVCELCNNEVTGLQEMTESTCCHRPCHSACYEICTNFLKGCPLCKKTFPDLRIFWDWGSYFTYCDRKDRLQAIKKKFIDHPLFGELTFGTSHKLYLARTGDLQESMEIGKRECGNLIAQINRSIEWINTPENHV
jgi:hypothetical protein